MEIKNIIRNKSVKKSIFLITLVSILQPYFVLYLQMGPSNSCWNCLIIEQTFFISLIYLTIPLCTIYLLLKKLNVNSILLSALIAFYYVIISFLKLTIPLFDDRIASWSTFSEQEIFDSALIMAALPMSLVVIIIVVLLINFNSVKLKTNEHHTLDEEI